MNPIQLVQMLSKGNPQQILQSVIQSQFQNNPMAINVLGMIKNNDSQGIEQLARNLAKEKGMDADQMYNQIKSMFNN